MLGIRGVLLASMLTIVTLSCFATVRASGEVQDVSNARQDDGLRDPTDHVDDVVAFTGMVAGDRVADIMAGPFIQALSRAVGPRGVVYAVEPDELVAADPTALTHMRELAADPRYSNIKIVTGPIDKLDLPEGLDFVFIRQNYHNLHDRFMGPADVRRFNRAVYHALLPGGRYVILDYAASGGARLGATDTLHRIDPESVEREVEQANFSLAGDSDVLENGRDNHSEEAHDPALRNKPDQFLFKFKKNR